MNSDSNYIHKSIMTSECLTFLNDEINNYSITSPVLVDCNLGEGGHSECFLKNIPSLKVIGIDRDSTILSVAQNRLSGFDNRVSFVNDWADECLSKIEKDSVDFVFFDFGISMFHFKKSERGFSFAVNEPLDMRLDENQLLSAFEVINKYREENLADVIYKFSGEKKSRKIANKIVQTRQQSSIKTTFELKNIIDSCFNSFEKSKSDIEVSTRTFQAIRIEVNKELEHIEKAIDCAFNAIKKFGLIIALTFHSLEDRIVKWAFRKKASENNFEILTKKPITASDCEIDTNPACRSAKLRVIRRVI